MRFDLRHLILAAVVIVAGVWAWKRYAKTSA